jgi:mono/diheme cytochrome c family protein
VLVGAALLVGLGVACRIDPRRPQVRFGLAENTTRIGEDGYPVVPPKVQEHIRGSLEMLFGSPSHPQYMLLEEWLDRGFDPNYPQFAADEMGSGEFNDDELDGIFADNERAFRRQLELISEGRYGDVVPSDSAPDLEAYWDELMAEWSGRGEGFDEADFQQRAQGAFLDWYPTLRDSAELYRLQCLHCHGPEGGGDGPTADFLDPRPRDYRLGVFKFTPLKDKAVPRRQDLYRILDQGVTGTAMPSFRRFSRAQLEGLVDYVRLLSARGMVERDLVVTYEQDEAIPVEYVAESYADVWEKWSRAAQSYVEFDGEIPAPTPESIARGRQLFVDATTGNCSSCHGDQGRGDGVAAFQVDPESGETVSAYQDDWGRDILPRNLTQGVFRGGRRPIDIYRRIYAGINGTPMPALGEAKDASGDPLLTPDELWSLVHYVGTLSERELASHAAADTHEQGGH